MKCNKCGMMNTPDSTYCQNCGAPLVKLNFEQRLEAMNPNVLCAISLVLMGIYTGFFGRIKGMYEDLFYDASFILKFFTMFTNLAPMIAIGLVVIVRVKHPENVFGKVLMWLYIVVFVLFVILIIIFVVSCLGILSSF